MRIVSLVPSLTHAVCDLGLREALVGVTKFCVEPKGLHRTAAIVGGTKDPDLAKIEDLKPTHIIVNEEENKPEHIAACRAIAPTLSTFPKSPYDVPDLLRNLGSFLGAVPMGEKWAGSIEERIATISRVRPANQQRVLYFIWREPYMVAGRQTYIQAMLEFLGFQNAAETQADRYPTLNLDQMRALTPQMLLLSSEPYPFRARDAKRLAEEWGADVPPTRWIDGQLMSWYGTMTLTALEEILKFLSGEPTVILRDLS